MSEFYTEKNHEKPKLTLVPDEPVEKRVLDGKEYTVKRETREFDITGSTELVEQQSLIVKEITEKLQSLDCQYVFSWVFPQDPTDPTQRVHGKSLFGTTSNTRNMIIELIDVIESM